MAIPNESPRIPQWTLGERMAKSRDDAGYSQAQMGAFFDVKAETVSTWETQTRQPKQFFEKLHRWAERCNVDYDWLVTGSGRILTYGDTTDNVSYAGFVVVDERQGRLELDPYPPSRIDPELSLVV